MHYFVGKEKYCLIYFTLLVCAHYKSANYKSANYKIHWNILVLYDQWKMMSDLNMSDVKMSDFVSFPLFGYTLAIKRINFRFESYWNNIFW